ncbi:MAG: patatin-like phospholipase family protein [Alphaproteobacteria bacterium]|nr:patatin-like phospholipase family protein [Alphaproteobacteria bacterium]
MTMQFAKHPPIPHVEEKIILVLQGGGALGSYQAGAFEALANACYDPEWIAGISIGSINAAIIAGNPPQQRLEKLKQFWQLVSANVTLSPVVNNNMGRKIFNEYSAFVTAMQGVEGFFRPRMPSPFNLSPVSYYDTSPLRDTLLKFVDFDYLNACHVRLSIGAVNVETGNFAYFDSLTDTICPEHIMASGALPPGFPPVEIDGQWYWDGGLVSNTPLQYVIDNMKNDQDSCIFQVDLYSASGPMPQTLLDVEQRESDIRYSSRTRLNTSYFKKVQQMRRTLQRLIEKLPEDIKSDPDWQALNEWSSDAAITVVHLINRRKEYQTNSKDYEFSRYSMQEHWSSGKGDVEHTLNHPQWLEREKPKHGVRVLDLCNK